MPAAVRGWWWARCQRTQHRWCMPRRRHLGADTSRPVPYAAPLEIQRWQWAAIVDERSCRRRSRRREPPAEPHPTVSVQLHSAHIASSHMTVRGPNGRSHPTGLQQHLMRLRREARYDRTAQKPHLRRHGWRYCGRAPCKPCAWRSSGKRG